MCNVKLMCPNWCKYGILGAQKWAFLLQLHRFNNSCIRKLLSLPAVLLQSHAKLHHLNWEATITAEGKKLLLTAAEKVPFPQQTIQHQKYACSKTIQCYLLFPLFKKWQVVPKQCTPADRNHNIAANIPLRVRIATEKTAAASAQGQTGLELRWWEVLERRCN